jgi:hypothetical protein
MNMKYRLQVLSFYWDTPDSEREKYLDRAGQAIQTMVKGGMKLYEA